jgi:hypothetical protein
MNQRQGASPSGNTGFEFDFPRGFRFGFFDLTFMNRGYQFTPADENAFDFL